MSMNFNSIISQILPQKKTKQELFFSLLLEKDSVAGAVWTVAAGGIASVIGATYKPIPMETWEDRIQAADVVIAQLEDKVGTGDIYNVILGLPLSFLTPEGDIQKEL